MAGIGNIFLGDDGFGSEVARDVANRIRDPRVRVTDYGIGGMHLAYDLLDSWGALVLIDAVPGKGCPGRLHIMQAHHETDSSTAYIDAHAMDPAAVFASLAALGGTPPPTVVIGCEVENVAEGLGLSDAVSASVAEASQSVEHVVAQLLSSNAGGK